MRSKSKTAESGHDSGYPPRFEHEPDWHPQRGATQIRGDSTSGFARSLTVQASFRLPEPEWPAHIARWKARKASSADG